ncbi:MAG: DsrE family protein [Sulfuricella sp.]|nr:DsrE family protein [Sulfuricella sp.]
MADKLAIMLLTIDPDHPHVCGTPFFQAAAAAAMDVDVEIYFASRSVRLLIAGIADSIYPSDNLTKTVYGFMKDAADLGVKFFACGGAMEPCDVTKEQLVAECTGIAGAATFVTRVMDDEWKTITY